MVENDKQVNIIYNQNTYNYNINGNTPPWNNNSKKKRFFAKIFSEPKATPASTIPATVANRKLNQPFAKMRSEAFNNDAKRFQSLKRVAIN